MSKLDIRKLDRIKLTQKDINLLFEWRDNHKDYVRAFKPVMKQGAIEIGKEIRQVFEDDGYNVIYSIYHRIGNEYKLNYILHWNKTTKIGKKVFSAMNQGFEGKEHEYNKTVISLHASLMAYMEYFGDKERYVSSKEKTYTMGVHSVNNSSADNNDARNPVKISRKVYRVSIDKDATVVDKRRYERHIDRWTQRGHWREYKNGKRVWIKPMVKGDGKDIKTKYYEL